MFNKIKKTLLVSSVIGIVGLAFYGVSNTINAFKDNQELNSSGDASLSINTTAYNGDDENGNTFCSPYGCSACDGCTSLVYQENIDDLTTNNNQDLIIN